MQIKLQLFITIWLAFLGNVSLAVSNLNQHKTTVYNWPIRFSRTFDLDYEDVPVESLIEDLNEKYSLSLVPHFTLERMREVEINGKLVKLPETYRNEMAYQVPVSIHLKKASYWEMVAKIVCEIEGKLRLDRGLVLIHDKNIYSVDSPYTVAGPYLLLLKTDELEHVIIDFFCFPPDVGEFDELKLDKLTICHQGTEHKVSGKLTEFVPAYGMFARWTSDSPFEIKKGMVVSSDIVSEVIQNRYYIDHLQNNSHLKHDNLDITVSDKLDTSDSSGPHDIIKLKEPNSLEDWCWWTIRASLNDTLDYGITKEEYDFYKESFYKQVLGEKLAEEEMVRYKKLTLKMPRLRFSPDGELVSIWKCEMEGAEKYCEDCAENKHSTIFEQQECRFQKQKSLDCISRDGLEIEVKIRNMRNAEKAWPVGLLVNEYKLKSTPFKIIVNKTLQPDIDNNQKNDSSQRPGTGIFLLGEN